MNIDILHYWRKVLDIALGLPGSEESSSHGTPSCKVKNKLFARLWEDGKTLAVYCSDRDKWMKARPAVYFITPHYNNYPMLLINLERVFDEELRQLLEASWEIRAPRMVVKQWRTSATPSKIVAS